MTCYKTRTAGILISSPKPNSIPQRLHEPDGGKGKIATRVPGRGTLACGFRPRTEGPSSMCSPWQLGGAWRWWGPSVMNLSELVEFRHWRGSRRDVCSTDSRSVCFSNAAMMRARHACSRRRQHGRNWKSARGGGRSMSSCHHGGSAGGQRRGDGQGDGRVLGSGRRCEQRKAKISGGRLGLGAGSEPKSFTRACLVNFSFFSF
ncbi:hypothetical protein QBC40DRAFT_81258 [Triangularia verruculosa]|uniref:Uncharacterized protein n=1 Tax=Triangularia verruculosa TaxID=2587418 RepID=A0AAN6XHM6_9PEZI|nr:hypothetical protein QBC40DRAFT_81258 [Triangularia verruculosa]